MNANAEDLRSFFVSHDGKKELVVRYDGVTRYTMDFSIMARDFAALLKANVGPSVSRREQSAHILIHNLV